MKKVDFLFIAIGLAGWLAVIIYAERIETRGRVWADRATDPVHFWVCVIAVAILVLAAFAQFLSGPFSD